MTDRTTPEDRPNREEVAPEDRSDDGEDPAGAGRIERLAVGLSTWFALSIPVNGLVLTFGNALGPTSDVVYPFGSLALAVALTIAVLRCRPGATDQVWTFALASFIAFLVVGFVAVPGFNAAAGLYGSLWVVLDHALAWTAALLVGYVVAYRGGRAAIPGGGTQ